MLQVGPEQVRFARRLARGALAGAAPRPAGSSSTCGRSASTSTRPRDAPSGCASIARPRHAARRDRARVRGRTRARHHGRAAEAAPPPRATSSAATKTLDAAGWRPGTDGIRVKDGVRLSSTIAVRPSRADLLAFGYGAAEQLAECGIELTVVEARPDRRHDARPAALAERLRHAPVGAAARHRPGHRCRRVRVVAQDDGEEPGRRERRRVHVELADHLIADARTSLDEADRTAAYAELQGLLDENAPYWPLWYEPCRGAVVPRRDGAGMIDPSLERFAWDVGRWSVTAPTS